VDRVYGPWTRTRNGSPWTEAVVRTMGWRRFAEGQQTGHYSLPVVTARSGGEKGRRDSVGGALDGDGDVAKRWCDVVKV
jgi:hypothetical protein